MEWLGQIPPDVTLGYHGLFDINNLFPPNFPNKPSLMNTVKSMFPVFPSPVQIPNINSPVVPTTNHYSLTSFPGVHFTLPTPLWTQIIDVIIHRPAFKSPKFLITPTITTNNFMSALLHGSWVLTSVHSRQKPEVSTETLQC